MRQKRRHPRPWSRPCGAGVAAAAVVVAAAAAAAVVVVEGEHLCLQVLRTDPNHHNHRQLVGIIHEVAGARGQRGALGDTGSSNRTLRQTTCNCQK